MGKQKQGARGGPAGKAGGKKKMPQKGVDLPVEPGEEHMDTAPRMEEMVDAMGDRGSTFWDQFEWQDVAVGEGDMVGVEQGGFMGLQEMPGESWAQLIEANKVAAQDEAAEGEKDADAKKEKKEKKEKKGTKEGTRDTQEDTKDTKEGTTDTNADKKKKKKRRKKKKKKPQQTGEGTNTPTTNNNNNEQQAAEAPAVDMAAWTPFQLHPALQRGLTTLGFASPTPVQERCLLPAVRDRKDVMAAAQTGSGKTLAFGLPVLHSLLTAPPPTGDAKALPALVLTPTRELAVQVVQHMRAAAQHTALKVHCIVGGMSVQKQQRLLRERPDVIVGTPGRVWALCAEGGNYLTDLSHIRALVFDEADRMVEAGHFAEVRSIVHRITSTQAAGVKRQTFLFSATLMLDAEGREMYTGRKGKALRAKREDARAVKKARGEDIDDEVRALVASIPLREKTYVCDLTDEQVVAGKVTQLQVMCTLKEKDFYLYYLVSRFQGRTLVFVNAISGLRRLRSLFTLLRVPVHALHAQMEQRQRLKNLERFTACTTGVLICTDVAARGLDIPRVDSVVHFSLPRSAEVYVHRSGRTARGTAAGVSVAFVCSEDMAAYKRICRVLHTPDGLPNFPVEPGFLAGVRERVRIARDIDKKLNVQNRKRASNSWMLKMAAEAELDVDEDMLERDVEGAEKVRRDAQMQAAKDRLAAMLAKPLLRAGSRSAYITKHGNVDALRATASGLTMLQHVEGVAEAAAAGGSAGAVVSVDESRFGLGVGKNKRKHGAQRGRKGKKAKV